MSSRRRDDTVRAVDLFCGAGGLSWGLAQACETMQRDVKLAAVNHWERAIETHKRNHSWADHYNAKVEELDPRSVFDTERVDILVGGPECTHHSAARGGRPVDEQKRASPWHVLDWLQKLYVDSFIIENVPEFRSWGPVGADGRPLKSKKGDTFDAWIDAIHSLGYSVDWTVLNAADYGDATSRRRLFIVGRRQSAPTFPDPTHSEHGDTPGTREWRPAADILDWSDLGDSVWTRDLELSRVHTPLKNSTMQRIAEGIRRHCHADLEPFADAVASITRDDVYAMRDDVVDIEHADAEADARDSPFLVEGPAVDADVDDGLGLCVPCVLGQQSHARAKDASTAPLPTISTRGAISVYQPEPFVLPRNGAHRGLHSNATYTADDRPLHTVTAKNHDGYLVTPFLVEYYGNSDTQPVSEPLPTVTTRDRFALVVPDHYPWGLDIRFRMLQPRELAAAMGFPEDYEFVGNKTETTEQIGNAVPVNLAQSLCAELLSERDPTLLSYTPGTDAIADGGGDDA